MLLAVHSRMPALYSCCSSAYNQPSVLFFGPYTVQSQEGAQQGDPIGPLLFCNTVHPLLSSLQSKLDIGFLDDVTLRGHVDVVASDVAEIIRLGAEIGLSLNMSKCELIAHSDLQLNDALLQSFSRGDIAVTTLLGTPLFHGPVLDNTWDQRCDDLSGAVDRLSSIASQNSLILLRVSFSAPKVLHMLRCSPSVSHSSLEKFDALLKQAIQRITNSDLFDLQWI